MAEVSVEDNGIGISEKNQEKIFRIDAQFRIDGTANEKGTGLGLILCKEFVEKNHGTIRIESKENEGCKFIFTIPLYYN
jgi:signal transduction histidine kinase